MGGNRARNGSEAYDLTPENETVFPDTRNNFNNIIMDEDSALVLHKVIESVKYDRAKDFKSKRTKSNKNDLTKRVEKTLNPP